eukprot:Tbor_TRINITY_DN8260_c0_g1::TRINITY_DN8260_c0_g1_i1::g.15396::m.15396
MLGARIRRIVESLTEIRMRVIEGELVAWSNLVDPFKSQQSGPLYGHLVVLPPEDRMETPVQDKNSDEEARNDIAARMQTYFMKLRVQHPFTHDVTSLCAWWRLDDTHSPAYEDFRRTAAGKKAEDGQKAIKLSEDFLSRTKTVGMGATGSDSSSVTITSTTGSESCFFDNDPSGKGSYRRALALLIEDAKMATMYSAAQARMMRANPGLVIKEIEQYNAVKMVRQRALQQRKETAERAVNVQNLREISVQQHIQPHLHESRFDSITKLNAAIATNVLGSSYYADGDGAIVEEPGKNEKKLLNLLNKNREKEEKTREAEGIALEGPGVEARNFPHPRSSRCSSSNDAVNDDEAYDQEEFDEQEMELLPSDVFTNGVNDILSNELSPGDIRYTPREELVTDSNEQRNIKSQIHIGAEYSPSMEEFINSNLSNNIKSDDTGAGSSLLPSYLNESDNTSLLSVTEQEEEYEDTAHIIDVEEQGENETDDDSGGASF